MPPKLTRSRPLIRHPIVYAPNDKIALGIVNEMFFLGSALLVAPVYSPTAQAVDVYLPDVGGYYVHLWSQQQYGAGETVTVAAPYGKPAVFVRYPLQDDEKDLLAGLFEFARCQNGTTLSVA